MTVTEKTFNLIAESSNKIKLPISAYRHLCFVGVDYLHVEFEKPTSNEYIKLTCDSKTYQSFEKKGYKCVIKSAQLESRRSKIQMCVMQ